MPFPTVSLRGDNMTISNKIMNLKKSKIAAAVVLGTMAVTQFSFADDRVRLNFGVYSSNKPTAMVRTFKPSLNALENSIADKLGLDVDIRMQIAKDYDKGLADLIEGKVDFSRFGPASYIEAKRVNKNIEILAMESKHNEKVFYGIIAVHKDSDIKSVEDLRGRSFAFGDESSTIGRYLSQLYLKNNDLYATDLSNYKYLGRHDIVGTAVGAGDFDAGALNESTFKKLVAKGEPIRELARFPNVTKPWIARQGLDPDVFAALQESLWELKDSKALKSLKVDGFFPGSDEDYQTIRTAMENNEGFFERPVVETAAVEPEVGAALAGTDNQSAPVELTSKGLNFQINLQFEDSEADLTKWMESGEPIVIDVVVPKQQ